MFCIFTFSSQLYILIMIKFCNFLKNNTLIIFVLLFANSFGQNNTIKVVTDLGSNYDYSNDIAIQNDGKVIQSGDAYGIPCMIRFDNNGVLDKTFGVDGIIFATWSAGSNPAMGSVKIVQDNKILLGTSIYKSPNTSFILARYDSSGSPDLTFGNTGHIITSFGKFSSHCNTIAIQADGQIIAAGEINNSEVVNDDYNFALVRYSENGAIDSTFGSNGIVTTVIGSHLSSPKSIAIQPDKKIIVAGEVWDDIFSDFVIVRYNSDGSLDTGFGNGGIVHTRISETYDFARSVVIQPDGKILVAGSSQSSLSNYDFTIVRYNTDGSLDSTFGVNGIVITDIGQDLGNEIVLLPDGKIILAGSSATYASSGFAVLRFNSDGTLDKSFGDNGLILNLFDLFHDSEGTCLALKNDGEIIVGGHINHGSPYYFDFATLRLFSRLMVGVVDVNNEPSGIIAYPNPIENEFGLSYTLTEAQRITIVLKDIYGRVQQIFLHENIRQSGLNTETLHLENKISKGTYLLEISGNIFIKSIKIIKG